MFENKFFLLVIFAKSNNKIYLCNIIAMQKKNVMQL